MWIADGWKDYEVLDTSGGEKLERWGDYLLVRPDPQVIWNTKKENPGWKKKNGHYHRSSKGGGEWEFFHLPEQWEINYKDLTFRLKPFSTLIGRLARRIRSPNQSQFVACSGKRPVCLKLNGFRRKVRSL